MPESVVGLLATRGEAEGAMHELERAGFRSNDIGIVTLAVSPRRAGRVSRALMQ